MAFVARGRHYVTLDLFRDASLSRGGTMDNSGTTAEDRDLDGVAEHPGGHSFRTRTCQCYTASGCRSGV